MTHEARGRDKPTSVIDNRHSVVVMVVLSEFSGCITKVIAVALSFLGESFFL